MSIFCGNCDHPISTENFCPNCGVNLREAVDSPPPVPPEAPPASFDPDEWVAEHPVAAGILTGLIGGVAKNVAKRSKR